MQREEITVVILEEEVPQDDPKEDAAPAENFPEEAPEETVAEAETPETVTEETDTEETDTEEDTSEETITEETDTGEDTTQKETVTEKETIQDREEIPETSSWKEEMTEYTNTAPASDLEYDVFEQILAEQQETNALLVRITNQNDLFLGIGVTLIICCICYSVLERFTRF